MIGHSGGNIGYRCLLRFWPELGLGAAVMTNVDDGSSLVNEIFASIGREYGWPDAAGAADTPLQGADPTDLAAFAGTWADDGALRLVTTVAADGLLLHLNGQSPLPLLAVGASSFIAEVAHAEQRFERTDDDAAEKLILRQLGQETRLQRVLP